MSETRKTTPKKGFSLPDTDHVMRHVPSSRLRRDENDNIMGFLPQAFELRPGEKSLSVNWLEFFDGDHNVRIKKAIHDLRAAKNIGTKSAFGIGRVDNIKTTCGKSQATVKIVYAPTKDNYSHSEIRRIPRDNLFLPEALATEAFVDLVRNLDIEEIKKL